MTVSIRAIVTALALWATSVAQGAEFVVTNTHNSGPGSLRQAINDANARPGLDAIRFDVIGVIGGTNRWRSLVVSDDLLISGPGADRLEIRGHPADSGSVIAVGSRPNCPAIELSKVKISRGTTNGIRSCGPVSISDSVISGNQRNGLSLTGEQSNHKIVRTTVTDNYTGIRASYSPNPLGRSGSLSIAESTISDNRGTGISASGVNVVVNRSAIQRNGEGIRAVTQLTENRLVGSVRVTKSTISGNSGDGIWHLRHHDAGQSAYAEMPELHISDSTIAENGRHGVLQTGTCLLITRCTTIDFTTISNNAGYGLSLTESVAFRVFVRKSIISGNALGQCRSTRLRAITSFNLVSDLSCGPNFAELQGVDPLLDTLRNNGGPTRTMALLPGSPAIDVIPSRVIEPWRAFLPGTRCTEGASDQRGVARPAGSSCDIGAYEQSDVILTPIPIAGIKTPVKENRNHKLIDEDLSTSWHNDGNLSNAWFELHLDAPTQLDQLNLAPMADRPYPFSVSIDGQLAGMFSTFSSQIVGIQSFQLPGTVGSMVRVESERYKWFKIHEVQLLSGAKRPAFADLAIAYVRVGAKAFKKDRLIDASLFESWHNDGNLENAWVELRLERPGAIDRINLAPAPNRKYRLNVYVDGSFATQIVTMKAADVAFQSFELPAGTRGSSIRLESANRLWIQFYEIEVEGQAD